MKKLSLNKETIANLNSDIMKNLNGGGTLPAPTRLRPCPLPTLHTNCEQGTCAIMLSCYTDGTCC